LTSQPGRNALDIEQRICAHLAFLYGDQESRSLWPQLEARLTAFRRRNPPLRVGATALAGCLTEQDAFLITYGDQFREPGRPPLQTLADFLDSHLREVVRGVHILPFFPYSSDDGFSVIDYRQVDAHLGTWADVARVGRGFRLMFDAVFNHISRQSGWFQAFLRGDPPYSDYFIAVDPGTDLSQVVRPRARPLLTPVETIRGRRCVWTTFSDDQIDLNYANPQVLLVMVDLLLFYVERGAEVIRLDAIAYLWKEIGTPCIHLPQAHHVVKLFRAVLDAVAPGVLLITETNVAHQENVSYFGDGTDEAQMVYQFPLAPLVLHTFSTGSARALSQWAATLRTPAPAATFFNFIASHDGIGVRPAQGLLSDDEVAALAARTLAHGGQVSYRANPDGSRSVYELNTTLFDALNDPRSPQPEVDVRRFLASQVIMLSLAGVPGIYVHSLLGSRNCQACVADTGRARSINREKLDRAVLEAELADPASMRHQVFQGYRHLLRQRRAHPAFHPNGSQEVLRLHDGVFALARRAPAGQETVVCLVNVTPRPQAVRLDLAASGLPSTTWQDLIAGARYLPQDAALALVLPGYLSAWLWAEDTPTS
jgi:glycosidase